jgi:hypothetical protein
MSLRRSPKTYITGPNLNVHTRVKSPHPVYYRNIKEYPFIQRERTHKMWKPGDVVQQVPSIFRVDAVVGKPMTVVNVIYPPGKDEGWPLRVITQCDDNLYEWTPEGLEAYGTKPNPRTTSRVYNSFTR